MTEPTTAYMRAWLNSASPQTKIKHQWVDVLLNRLEQVELVLLAADQIASDDPEYAHLLDDVQAAVYGTAVDGPYTADEMIEQLNHV